MPHEVMFEFADFYSGDFFEEVFSEYNNIRAQGFGAFLRDRLNVVLEEFKKAKQEYSTHHDNVHDALKEKEAESVHVRKILVALNKNRESKSIRGHHIVLMDTIEDVDDDMKSDGTFWYCKCRMLEDEIKWVNHLLEKMEDILAKGPLPELEQEDVRARLKKAKVGAHFLLFRNYFKELEDALEGEIDVDMEKKLRNHLLKIMHTEPNEFEGASLKEQYNFILKFYEELLKMQEADLKAANEPEDFALSVAIMTKIGKDLEMLEYTMRVALEALG